VTEVASGTQALSDAEPAVAPGELRQAQPRRAPHLPQLRRRTRAQTQRELDERT
jgi:hypothetical protein